MRQNMRRWPDPAHTHAQISEPWCWNMPTNKKALAQNHPVL
jgi:hypothetical protein